MYFQYLCHTFGSSLPKCDANVQHFILSCKHFANFFRKLPVKHPFLLPKRVPTGKSSRSFNTRCKYTTISINYQTKHKKTPHHHDGELRLIGILYNLSNGTTTKVQQLFNIAKLFEGKIKKSLLLVKILFVGQFFANL